MEFLRASERYAESYSKAVDAVARERRYLAAIEGFPLASSLGLVRKVEREDLAQYFAVEGDQVVGWRDLIPLGFDGLRHIGMLGMGVLSAYRGLGLGRRLLELALAHAKEKNGVEKAELEVFRSNEGAVRFYERNGFGVEGARPRHRKLDGAYDDIILMGKFL
jgi:ribosomal protein S18 acetylase RimI-like enzyme